MEDEFSTSTLELAKVTRSRNNRESSPFGLNHNDKDDEYWENEKKSREDGHKTDEL